MDEVCGQPREKVSFVNGKGEKDSMLRGLQVRERERERERERDRDRDRERQRDRKRKRERGRSIFFLLKNFRFDFMISKKI